MQLHYMNNTSCINKFGEIPKLNNSRLSDSSFSLCEFDLRANIIKNKDRFWQKLDFVLNEQDYNQLCDTDVKNFLVDFNKARSFIKNNQEQALNLESLQSRGMSILEKNLINNTSVMSLVILLALALYANAIDNANSYALDSKRLSELLEKIAKINGMLNCLNSVYESLLDVLKIKHKDDKDYNPDNYKNITWGDILFSQAYQEYSNNPSKYKQLGVNLDIIKYEQWRNSDQSISSGFSINDGNNWQGFVTQSSDMYHNTHTYMTVKSLTDGMAMILDQINSALGVNTDNLVGVASEITKSSDIRSLMQITANKIQQVNTQVSTLSGKISMSQNQASQLETNLSQTLNQFLQLFVR